MQKLETETGRKYVISGGALQHPSPVLLNFATDAVSAINQPSFNEIGHILSEYGVLTVSLDLPCHGEDERPDEATGLDGWRIRLDKGENIIANFISQAREVIDDLVQKGITDSERLAVCGTSRGGFMALHLAASDSRIKWATVFAPVTSLGKLHEFASLRTNPECALSIDELDTVHLGEKLAEVALWISIGNADNRVGTDEAIAFARRAALVRISRDTQPIDIELHVMPSMGHHTPVTAHRDAAAWLRPRLCQSICAA